MASLRVYAPVDGGRVIKVRIAAQYADVELKFVEGFKFGETNKTPEFLAKFPLGKVPAVETPYGPLTESGAIARYIARIAPGAGLLGGGFYQQSLVDQWIDFATTEIEGLLPKWLGPIWGITPFDKATYDQAKESFWNLTHAVDQHLVANTFIAGDTITLADISLWAAYKFFFGNVVTEADLAPYASVLRWWNTLAAQKQFLAVVPDFKFATEEKLAAGNPKAGGKAAAAAPAAEKKAESKAEPKAESKPEPKPEPKAAPAPVDTEEEEKPKAAPAPKEEAKKGKGKKEAKQEAKKETPASPKAEAKKEAKAEPKVETPASPKAEAKKEQPKSAKKEAKQEQPKTPKAEAKKEQPKSAKKGGKK